MTHKATKIVIITEKLIFDGVTRIIEDAGASGYTAVAAGALDAFANIKIEVITANRDMAVRIADEVAARYFEDYSGITYLEEVEVLRPHKF